MVGDMSSILSELTLVQDQLAALSADAVADRTALLARRDELHVAAARMADKVDEDRPTQDLLAQLAALRRQLGALERQRAAAPARPGMRVENSFRPSQGQPSESRIEARIRRIQWLLSQRGIDIR